MSAQKAVALAGLTVADERPPPTLDAADTALVPCSFPVEEEEGGGESRGSREGCGVRDPARSSPAPPEPGGKGSIPDSSASVDAVSTPNARLAKLARLCRIPEGDPTTGGLGV